MDLIDQLQQGNSRSNRDRIARWIGRDARRFEKLMRIYLKGDLREAQLAAGVLFSSFEFQPSLVAPWLSKILRRMTEHGVHPAVRRVGVWILQKTDIPPALQGPTVNACFRFLSDPSQPLAIRAFSMRVLARLAKTEPDLAHELKQTLESILPYGTLVLQNHGRIVLRELEKRDARRKSTTRSLP